MLYVPYSIDPNTFTLETKQDVQCQRKTTRNGQTVTQDNRSGIAANFKLRLASQCSVSNTDELSSNKSATVSMFILEIILRFFSIFSLGTKAT